MRDSRKCSKSVEGNVYLPSSKYLFIFMEGMFCSLNVFWFIFFTLTVESLFSKEWEMFRLYARSRMLMHWWPTFNLSLGQKQESYRFRYLPDFFGKWYFSYLMEVLVGLWLYLITLYFYHKSIKFEFCAPSPSHFSDKITSISICFNALEIRSLAKWKEWIIIKNMCLLCSCCLPHTFWMVIISLA